MILDKPCEVITFYSYTGGAGRSMALANVACLLAPHCQAGRGVLMVDWSLQSPSLHRYFLNKVETWSGGPKETEQARSTSRVIRSVR
jgi:cellulose biosynthesis protein BcsQ